MPAANLMEMIGNRRIDLHGDNKRTRYLDISGREVNQPDVLIVTYH